MQGSDIEAILQRLNTADSMQGWKEFLHAYSGLMLQVIRHFERDADAAANCYLFVCEQLRRKNFHRLRKFRVGGPTRFTTYLRAVVRNLCVDWHRKEFGRLRVFQSVEKRSALEQEIFQRVFEQGATVNEARELLRPRFPHASCELIAECRERLQAGLSERQRWLLSVRRGTRAMLRPGDAELDRGAVEAISDGGLDPETLAAQRETQARLRDALAGLDRGERLLLQLRYAEELTLEQVARLVGLGNAQQADRRIREILEKLRRAVG